MIIIALSAVVVVGHQLLADKDVAGRPRSPTIKILASMLICSLGLGFLLADNGRVGFSCLDAFLCTQAASS